MLLQRRQLRSALLAASVLTIGSLTAAADPLFGPTTYVRTSAPTDVYNDVATAPAGGQFALFVHNGDDGGNRVTSGSVEINGVALVGDSELGGPAALIRKPVTLLAGANTVRVTLGSAAGSSLTVSILRKLDRPDATIGRLLLPHGSASNLVIELKNASHAGPRGIKLVFFDEVGAVVASSNRINLARHASLSEPVANLIQNGAWSQGSIEIFFAGPGPGGVHGQAAISEPTSGISSIVPLQFGGFLRLEPPRPHGGN